MTQSAILLLLCSAFIHAGWNLITKKQNPSGAFFLVSHVLTLLCSIPCFVWFGDRLGQVPGSVWGWLALSGLFNGIYYFSLAWAYRKGDLSLAYPLAKSLPTLFIAVLAFALGQGRQIGPWAVVGFALVIAGCMLLPMQQLREFRFRDYLNVCCLLAVVAAAGTAGYTLTDNAGVRILRQLPNTPMKTFDASFVYLLLLMISSTSWLGVGVMFSRAEREHFTNIWRTGKLNALLAGIGIYLAYTLVLISMAHVRNVSYVSAFRQTCILIGAILGIAWLKERAYPGKVIGIVLTFAGLILVAIG